MQTFAVSGMTCAHCVRAVTEAIRALDPAADVQVDLENGRVVVRGQQADAQEIAGAIQEEGYEARPLQT